MITKGKYNAEAPKFKSLEEERAYWEARGPLAKGHRARTNKPQPAERRRSFISVRLTGEELTHLRDAAARVGLGPSTFARTILIQAMQPQETDKRSGRSTVLAADSDRRQEYQ